MAPWVRLYASSPDFWNKKQPADWSAEEIQQLTTHSPWAKEVTAESSQGGGGMGGRGGGWGGGGGGWGGGGMGGGGGWGGGMGGRGRGGGGRGGGRGGGQPVKGMVRWESAKPILEALKTKLPDSFADHYVISVSGFPMMSGRRRWQGQGGDEGEGQQNAPSPQEMLDRLKSFTSLEPKDKPIAQPGVVERQKDDNTVLLFGFSKQTLALSPGDKEVTFSTRLGRLTVKTKFNLKEMLYHGELAV